MGVLASVSSNDGKKRGVYTLLYLFKFQGPGTVFLITRSIVAHTDPYSSQKNKHFDRLNI